MPLTPKLRLAAITDEFSPRLSEALPLMKEIGMVGAELRVVNGKNVMDLNSEELAQVKAELTAVRMPVVCIASPLLKCVLPDSPALDTRFEQDVFASKHTYADQEQLASHALELAAYFGAPIIRVFSFWRTVDPAACAPAIHRHLSKLADMAAGRGIQIGLENEHACNVGTDPEAAAALQAVPHPNLQLVWDPANSLVAGENDYAVLPKARIAHVHAKDCQMENGRPVWAPLGTRSVRWKEHVAGLLNDGYSGYLSLETHWPGPNNDKLEASRICGWNLRGLACG